MLRYLVDPVTAEFVLDLGESVEDMRFPAECLHCRNVHDLAAVTVVDRYSDCSTWVSPCCRRLVDDRPIGWGGGIRRLLVAGD